MTDHRLPDGTHAVLLSADSRALLRADAAALRDYLADRPAVAPNRVSEMLFRTRAVRRFRALLAVSDTDELQGALRAVADGGDHPAVIGGNAPATARRHAFVFPGQGGQRRGMARAFAAASPAFRAEAQRCNELFVDRFGLAPLDYALGAENGPDSESDSPSVVQPALFVQMAGLAAMWRAAGVEPAVTVGHSQGEIAAAYVAGTISLEDAVAVVGIRSQAVESITSDRYLMAVVAAGRDEVEELLARRTGWAQLSVVNAPSLVAVSGDRDTVARLVAALDERGRFTKVVKVPYPAHTDMIDRVRADVASPLAQRLAGNTFADTGIDCIGATLGASLTPDLPPAEYWFWNLRNTVRFDKAIGVALDRGVDSFVELAEHPTLALSIQQNLDRAGAAATVTGTSTRTDSGLREFSRNLAALAVGDLHFRWACLDTEPAGRVRLPLRGFPNLALDEEQLWLPYSDPAQRPVEASAAVAEHPTQLLTERWTPLTKRTLLPPRTIGLVDHTGECAALVETLVANAADFGATARRIATAADLSGIDTVAVVLPAAPAMDVDAAMEATAEFFGERHWWLGSTGSATDFWLITRHGDQVPGDDQARHLFHAAAAAGFRAVGAEHPGVLFRHLDISPEPTTDEQFAIVAALHTADETELALRGNDVYAKRLVERESARAAASAREVLVIGGTGKIGMEFCEYFATRGARRVTLVSRSGETAATAERLERLRSSGTTEIVVRACDVRDDVAVKQLAAEFQDRPVDLVVQTAVDYSDADLPAVTAELVRQAVRTKIGGIATVLDVIPRTAGCRVLMSSSIASTLSGRGQVVYAASNRMLDAFADQRRAGGLECSSVQWGRWTVHLDLGVTGSAKLDGMGATPMASIDAIELSLAGIAANSIVAAFDWEHTQFALSTYGYGPVLAELVAPGATPPAPIPAPAPAPAAPADVPERLRAMLAEILRLPDSGKIDAARPMVQLGLDSLLAIGLRQRINADFDRDVPVADLLNGASLDDVARVVGDGSAAAPTDFVARAIESAEHAVPHGLDPERVRTARVDLDLFGLQAMLRTLEPVLGDGEFHGLAEIAERTSFQERHLWLLRRWLGALTDHGSLERRDGSFRLLRAVETPTRADLFEVCADIGYPREFATFLHRSDDELALIAQDRVRVQELLFPDGDMLTAEALYTENLISRYLNLAARELIRGLVSGLERDRRPVKILELGAGIGGLTVTVAQGLTDRAVDYHFTDVSPFFLDAARDRFAQYPWLRYGIVDVNADLGRQEPYDVVIAANVLHNATNVGETLRQIHDLLRPGGAIVFVEACRAHMEMLTSVHFLMSPRPGLPRVGTADVRAGSDRIFLTEAQWHGELVAAGLQPAATLPQAGHPLHVLDQRVFAAVRE